MKRLLFLLWWLFPFSVFAAVETTTISGKVVMPNGVVATGGTIVATLSTSGSAPDLISGAAWNVGGRFTGTIAADGTVTGLVLVPNDVISPSGTYYTVSINVTTPTRDSRLEKWSIVSSPDPVSIGAVNRLDRPPSLRSSIADASDVNLSGLLDEQCLIVDVPGGIWTNKQCVGILPADGTNCSGNNFALGVDTSGNAQCAQPAFSNLSGSATDAQIPDNITASSYLPLAGGTMTGTINTDDTYNAIKLPQSGTARHPAIEFTTQGDPDFVRGSWFLQEQSLDQSINGGWGSEDHVFSLAYNGLKRGDGGLDRIVDGEHIVQFNLESGFVGGTYPSIPPPCDAGADPTCVGNFEWNINIDRNITGPGNASKRVLFFAYEMGMGATPGGKTGFYIGDESDPNSIHFEVWGLPKRGLWDAGIGLVDAGFVVYNRKQGADDTFDAPGRILINPYGGTYNDNTRQAIISLGFALPTQDDLNIEPGRAAGGATGSLRLGYYHKPDIYIAQADDGGGGADGGQLHVSNKGIEFDEDTDYPTCDGNDFNIYADGGAPYALRMCNNATRSTILGGIQGSGVLSFGSSSAGNCETLTFAVTGADTDTGQMCSVGAPGYVLNTTGSVFTCFAYSLNNVAVRHCCVGPAACDPPNTITYRVTLLP